MGLRSKSERSKKSTDSEAKKSGPPKRASTNRVYTAGTGPDGKNWHLEWISGYNLRWECLRDWLYDRFEGNLEFEEQNCRDWFEAHLPRKLTKADLAEIDKLRVKVYEEPEELYERDPAPSP